MATIITIIAFLVIFSLLILVHELGHFLAAKKSDVKVEEFGFGLPPRAWGKKIGETIYSLNWVPLGGFVRMLGQDDMDAKSADKAGDNPRSYTNKSWWQRFFILVAGVALNFVMAILLFTIAYSVGCYPLLESEDYYRTIATKPQQLTIEEVLANKPATEKLEKDDLILAINGISVANNQQFMELQKRQAGAETVYLIKRGEEEKQIIITPSKEGEIGVVIETIVEMDKVRYLPHIALIKGAKETWRISILTVKGLGKVVWSIIYRFTVPEGVAGPVGIFKITSKVAKLGITPLIQFAALLSASIGVINIMPFPALDGGRLLFLLIEPVYAAIFGRKHSAQIEGMIHLIGFALLILFILAITWHDVFVKSF